MICFGNFHSTSSRGFIIFWDELYQLGEIWPLSKGRFDKSDRKSWHGSDPLPLLAVTEYWAFLVLNVVIFNFWSTPLNHLNFILNQLLDKCIDDFPISTRSSVPEKLCFEKRRPHRFHQQAPHIIVKWSRKKCLKFRSGFKEEETFCRKNNKVFCRLAAAYHEAQTPGLGSIECLN